MSVSEGLDWEESRWVPNTIALRERWNSGKASGLAVASSGSNLGESTYQATIQSASTWLASIEKLDSHGNRYRREDEAASLNYSVRAPSFRRKLAKHCFIVSSKLSHVPEAPCICNICDSGVNI